jgi:hypothetical protein
MWKRARLSGRRFLVSAPSNGDGPETHLCGELNSLMAKPPRRVRRPYRRAGPRRSEKRASPWYRMLCRPTVLLPPW